MVSTISKEREKKKKIIKKNQTLPWDDSTKKTKRFLKKMKDS
jgi:hypothetical protein